MRCAREIRAEGWQRLWKDKWFWKVLLVSFLLGMIVNMAMQIVTCGYTAFGVMDLNAYLQQVQQAKQAGEIVPVPVRETWIRMGLATGFYLFIAYVFSACAEFGKSLIVIRAARDEREDWMSGVFGGFRRPLGLFVQMALMTLIILFWGLFLIVPGIIAVYRYSQSFFIRAEHPDWSAFKCLRESARIMDGNKWRLFCLHLSYLGYILVAFAPAFLIMLVAPMCLAGGKGAQILGVLFLLVMMLCLLALILVVSIAITVGFGIFYRDLVAERPLAADEDADGNEEVAA